MKLFRLSRPRQALVLVSVLVAALAPSASSTQAAAGDLLPDLITLAPSDLQVTTTRKGGGKRQLRFSNTIANQHTGVLEMTPVSEDCDGDGKARNDRSGYQRIYSDADGDGVFTRGIDTTFRLVKAGCFDFHPTHHHWHFEDFSRYELTTYSGGRGAVVASTQKVSFCIIDSYQAFAGLIGSPGSRYFAACSRDGDQGLSVGWADVYGAHLAGQELDITALADGTYCLVSTADPANRLVETDDANNEAAIRISLAGTTVNPTGTC